MLTFISHLTVYSNLNHKLFTFLNRKISKYIVQEHYNALFFLVLCGDMAFSIYAKMRQKKSKPNYEHIKLINTNTSITPSIYKQCMGFWEL